ncbi:MAG: YlmH/Sll1252 family protein [Defluviitaleaceae bacterium]|nr:YlmH/Sll1252 family protein [Defluviitaleaceae bacterium]
MTKKLHELSRFLGKLHKSDSDYAFAKVLDQVYLCLESGIPQFTNFLDPLRLNFAQNSLRELDKFGIDVLVNGGYNGAERKILGFFPEHEGNAGFPIAKILIQYEAKYANLTHSDFLGAILGLGLDRSVIGDVVILPTSAVILAEAHISDFLLSNLHKVGKTSVSTRCLADDEHFFGMDNRVRDRLICSSPRLDNVLAVAFKLSRSDAASLIKSGKAFINWQEANSPTKTIKEGDMLTLRKHGRVQIVEFAGKSKKDYFLIDIIRF